MNRIKAWSLLFSLLIGAVALAPQVALSKTKATKENISSSPIPKRIQATYEVTKNGEPFANVHELFVVTKNAYTVESTTKGLGVYALLGERKLTSVGVITAKGLQPTHFELHQGNHKKKSLFTDFDWAKRSLVMTIKGKQETAELKAGTQDLASYAYQFMFMRASLKNTITLPLTTGKKLKQYQYKVNPEQKIIDGAGVQYKTLHLTSAEKDGSETKELWLATEHYYVPVRILMIDDDGHKLEQTLTELRIE
ncbi:MAG: DUF3108 domain-containing protein [Methylotenera sp.]|nr:DUF3108 domain-containing protein [Methylotenera sp.]